MDSMHIFSVIIIMESKNPGSFEKIDEEIEKQALYVLSTTLSQKYFVDTSGQGSIGRNI